MFKMIGGDGREYGPVSAEQLREWIADSRANGQTLVQPEGSTEWRPLSSFPEFAGSLHLGNVPPALAEDIGANAGPPTEFSAEAASGEGRLDVGASLGHGWALLGRHPGLLLGATALVWLLTTLAAFVPLIGFLISCAITGPLFGGLMLVYLRAGRGEETQIGDVFGCFGPRFVPLMLVWIVTDLVSKLGMACCLVVPGLLLKVFWAFALVLAADRKLDFGPALGTSWRAASRQFVRVAGLLLISWLPLIVFTIYSVFEVNQYIIQAIGPMTPAKLDNPFATLMEMMRVFTKPEHLQFFMKLELGQQLVLLLNLPFALAALTHAYETVFRPHAAQAR
jgi:hypothetical protein